MGIELTQKIIVSSPWLPTNKEIIRWVTRKTLANKLVKGEFKILKTP
jgi:hypothetical protein